MGTIEEIKDIAVQKLNAAKILVQNGDVDNAFYLAGYSIELELKAKVCELLNFPDLFNEEGEKVPKIGQIRKKYKTHDLFELLIHSGLKAKYDFEKGRQQMLFDSNALLFENWNENCRYKPCGYYKLVDVERLIEMIEHPENGIRKWIRIN